MKALEAKGAEQITFSKVTANDTEGLFNQPTAPPPPVSPLPSSSSRGIRASPAFFTIQLDDLDMTDSD